MSAGEPHRPLLLYVGRLGAKRSSTSLDPSLPLCLPPFCPPTLPPSSPGAEKNVHLIREVLKRIPEARLAIVGAGISLPQLLPFRPHAIVSAGYGVVLYPPPSALFPL